MQKLKKSKKPSVCFFFRNKKVVDKAVQKLIGATSGNYPKRILKAGYKKTIGLAVDSKDLMYNGHNRYKGMVNIFGY